MSEWEVVIGLEVHCQLSTQSKIFSGAPTTFGQSPNTQVATVDLGLPGVLPVLNKEVPELAVKAGLALGCTINQTNQFARKNYFYPDLPKGYQISQHTLPICEHGTLDIETEQGAKTIGVTRIHMEEDAGKSTHISGKPFSIVDLNRAGVPLIEIVSEPDMRNADEAIAYLKELRSIVRYLGVCDGNMEEGSFRCDANVSVRKPGEPLGTRCELKNINSFKFVKDAINYEVQRQIEMIEDGEEVIQQTRLYNPDKGITFAMRSKEDAHDYRYFPDPDLPILVVDDAWLTRLKDEQPELPSEKRVRYQAELKLSAYDAGVLSAEREIAEYFEAALEAFSNSAKTTANWVINEVLRETDAHSISEFAITPEYLGQIVQMLDSDEINGKIAKTVFAKALESGDAPSSIVENEGLKQVTDTGAIEEAIDQIIADNPDNVAEFRSGKEQLIGWFVGQVMRATQGKANPKMVNELLRKKLNDA